MKVLYWPVGETTDAHAVELATLDDLWRYIRQTPVPVDGEPGVGYVREVSANDEMDGTPYLVLSWVEVTEE